MFKPIQPLSAYITGLVCLFYLVACKPPQNRSYFQTITRDTVLRNTVSKNFDLKIKSDDLLNISVSSASPELSGLFNAAQGTGGSAAGSVSSGYQVDKKGTIQFYKLGDVKVTGLTRSELKELLQRELSAYLKDPVVTVRFANHRVTVLGEVGSPGVIALNADQMTVLEAIGQSGDLTENARREKVMVIRQTEAGKEFRHLNLLDHSVFSSPYYYLQNDDVVYVEADTQKREPQKTQQVMSFVLSGLSIITFIITRIR